MPRSAPGLLRGGVSAFHRAAPGPRARELRPPLAPGIAVIAFAGLVDVEALEAAGIPCVPRWRPQPTRMARTLAYLGPRPVIDLHCAGLKVAERAVRAAARGASVQEVAHILEPIGGLVGSADCAGGQ